MAGCTPNIHQTLFAAYRRAAFYLHSLDNRGDVRLVSSSAPWSSTWSENETSHGEVFMVLATRYRLGCFYQPPITDWIFWMVNCCLADTHCKSSSSGFVSPAARQMAASGSLFPWKEQSLKIAIRSRFRKTARLPDYSIATKYRQIPLFSFLHHCD